MNKTSEANCTLVCSRGLMKSCDIYPPVPVSSIRTLYSYPWESVKNGQIIYVNGSAIPAFLREALPLIKEKFILVSGDCDETIPADVMTAEEFNTFVNDDRLICWFSQNLTITNNLKCVQIPIGMDYHTLSEKDHWWGPKSAPLEQEKMLLGFRKQAQPPSKRTRKGYCNFHFQMNTRYGKDRQDALKEVGSHISHYEQDRVSRKETWAIQKQYSFVISPAGGGLDCHRTWEAIALGCIPVIRSSPLDSLFEGLPVMIIQKWSDCSNASFKKFLENKSDGELFNKNVFPEKMLLSYWVNKIRDSAKSSAA
jgi:hypothetical protein